MTYIALFERHYITVVSGTWKECVRGRRYDEEEIILAGMRTERSGVQKMLDTVRKSGDSRDQDLHTAVPHR